VLGIGAPPVRLAAAVEDFLAVDPIGLAVEDRSRAVRGWGLFGLGRHIHHVEVVAADGGDEPAVGGVGGKLLAARGHAGAWRVEGCVRGTGWKSWSVG